MTSELIKCPYCGYKYLTDIQKIVENGKTVAARLGLSDVKNILGWKTPKSSYIDLTCPNCEKAIEWEVKT